MKCVFPLGALALLCWSGNSLAASPTSVWFVGGDFSDSVSLYGGSVVSLPGNSLGHGFAVRTSVGMGRYRYRTSGAAILGKYFSGEAAMVHQSSGKWGWANLSIGPRYSRTTLSPGDPNNKLRGSRFDAVAQTDGALDSAEFRLNWFASYGFRYESYLGKLELARKSGHGISYGIQTGIGGDPHYRRVSAGGLIRKSFRQQIDLQIGGGIADQPGRKSKPYLSLGLSQSF